MVAILMRVSCRISASISVADNFNESFILAMGFTDKDVAGIFSHWACRWNTHRCQLSFSLRGFCLILAKMTTSSLHAAGIYLINKDKISWY